MVRRPFAANLSAATTLDLGRRDEYVLADTTKRWRVDESAVHARAIANLEAMSRDIELSPRKVRDGAGSYVAVKQGDAYDAARILLPAFRGRLLDVLGAPAYAGVKGIRSSLERIPFEQHQPLSSLMVRAPKARLEPGGGPRIEPTWSSWFETAFGLLTTR